MKILNILLILCFTLILFEGSSIQNGYDVGDTAIDFKLKNIDGKMVSLSDYQAAKGFIVIFDCNTCPYSKAYNDRIIALSKKYSKDFPVIAINSNSSEESPGDSFQEMVKHSKTNGYDFPYLLDETQSVAKTYGATNTPHVFVLNKIQNTLKVAYIGTIDDNARKASSVTKRYVEEAIQALLEGKPISTTKTKAIGCGIKWKDA